MKKVFFIFVIIALLTGAVLYFFRQQVLEYSAETLIKKNLPEYVSMENITFDLADRKVRMQGFAVKNPDGYRNRHLAVIDSVTCGYKMKGSTILDGIEITEIKARGPLINIERRGDGNINLAGMGSVMEGSAPRPGSISDTDVKKSPERDRPDAGRINIADIIKLPDTINIEKGRIVFLDEYVSRKPYILTFDDISCFIKMPLSENFSKVLSLETEGKGILNSVNSQKLDWRVTMSSPDDIYKDSGVRINLENIDILSLEPYYEAYSPIIIQNGAVSGTLVVEFDNGNIGSQNSLVLRDLVFVEKEDGRGASYWQAAMVPEIVRYLSSSGKEVFFDFTVKGPRDNLRINPGPKVRQALQSRAISTVADMFTKKENGEQNAPSDEGTGKSDVDQVVDIIRGILNR